MVKVETADRLDGARGGDSRMFDLLHVGHESVVVDRCSSSDRALLRTLLDRADVVVESSRPRAMESLGIDPLDVCRRTPTTWVAITAYGRDAGHRVGFGDDVGMAAGLAARQPGQAAPIPCGDALADPLTGMHAAVAALASCRLDGSRLLDIAMCDVVAATIAWHPSVPPIVRLADGEWFISGPDGDSQVALPSARTGPSTHAAPPGRDTASWRQA